MIPQTVGSFLKRSATRPVLGAALVFLLWLIPCQSPPPIPESLRFARFAGTLIAAGAAVLAMRWYRVSGVTILRQRVHRLLRVLAAGAAIFVLIFVFCVVYYDREIKALIPVGFPGLDCCEGQDRKDCIHDRLNSSGEAIAECWGVIPVTSVRLGLIASYWWTACASGAWIGLLLLRWGKSTVSKAGLPEASSRVAPRPTGEAMPPEASQWEYDMFLSYSHKDRDFVERLDNDLSNQGYVVWWDHTIGAGGSVFGSIDDGLEKSRQFAVVLSPDSCKSRWVRREIGSAMSIESERLEQEVGAQAPFLIPILYRECKIPALLKDTEHVDFTHSYEQGFAELIRELLPPSGPPPTGGV
jgi:hypothetical protein